MEKELKDMTKEEIDALIHEYYEKHQKLWLTIVDILGEAIAGDLVDFRENPIMIRLAQSNYFPITFIKNLAFERLGFDAVLFNCFACEFNSHAFHSIDCNCSRGCFLGGKGNMEDKNCTRYGHPYCTFKRCVELAAQSFYSRRDPLISLGNVRLARNVAIKIANLPLREFDYENLCFK